MARPENQYPEPRLKKQRSGVYWLHWSENGNTRKESTQTKDEREARILLNRKSLELLTLSDVNAYWTP